MPNRFIVATASPCQYPVRAIYAYRVARIPPSAFKTSLQSASSTLLTAFATSRLSSVKSLNRTIDGLERPALSRSEIVTSLGHLLCFALVIMAITECP